MQLHQLRALVAAADFGTISAAARALELSQPAVTRALKQLERDCQATLLTRSKSGITLTSCGEELVLRARRILDETRRASEQVAQMIGSQSGNLVIASSAVPIAVVVAPAIKMMRQRFPDVHVRLLEAVYPTVMSLFRTATIDFAIGPVPSGGLGQDYRCDRLFDVDLVVVVKRGHRLSKARSLADLVDLDWVITGPQAGPAEIQEEAFKLAGLGQPRCVMHCESIAGALQLIQHSQSASYIPKVVAEEAQAAGLVNIVPIKEKPPRALPIGILLPTTSMLTPAGQALYSAIRTVGRSLKAKSAH